MKITCRTVYDFRTLSAMSLVMRKTIRRRFNRLVSIYLWAVAALLAVSIWLSLDKPLRVVWYGAALILLLAVQLRQDAVNAFFARRRLIPGTRESRTVFYPDCYEVAFPGAATRWEYGKPLLLAETRDYFVLVLGEHHAQAFPKNGLEGGGADEFRSLLERATGKCIQTIGRW